MSLKEMPVKKLPTILLLDLRRRGIYVPPEIQRRIMWFKEMTELREAKEQVCRKIEQLELCGRLQMPLTCGEKEWKGFFHQIPSQREPEHDCYWCNRAFRELLSIGARAQVNRPVPNLRRLYNECSWLAMFIYREGIVGELLGAQLTNGNSVTPQMDSVESVIYWMGITTGVVDVMLSLNRIQRAYEH